jgi:hypothetical protein
MIRKSEVTIIKGTETEQMVNEALSMIRGMDSIMHGEG